MKKLLWGGRFKKGIHPVLESFSYSFASDCELMAAELKVNEAYAKMLAKVGIITAKESRTLVRGLKAIAKNWKSGSGKSRAHSYEDIHSFIQMELEKRVGMVAKKIHTGRSRNDLVVTSTKIYLRQKTACLEAATCKVQQSLVGLAQKSGEMIIPGMTHLRKAQPVLFAHHLLAYVEMLEEDKDRFKDCAKRINVLPLGSAALAGSSLPLNQKYLARELGFSKIATNSLAAVSDRAFLTEFLSCVALLWMHLSRLSEDFILWNSEAFGFIELGDPFATGSSLMPQKKNPDVFELIRGRSGVIFGSLQALFTIQKGLPLAYNRDLQEDKPGVFDGIHKTLLALELLALTFDSVSLKKKAIENSLKDDGLFATDVLEYLVQKKVPFSKAHQIVGNLIRHAAELNKPLRELSLRDWKKFSKYFAADIYDLFDPKGSVRAKKTIGSTHPRRVKEEIMKWKRALKLRRSSP